MTRAPSAGRNAFDGRAVTVIGLGLFGGGATVARYLSRRGARVTITDLRHERELAPALRELAGFEVRLVLGEHRFEDFTHADLVIANPAVAPASPYLAAARAAGVPISSETALFLASCPARIAAITGTQGKSSTCHALAQLLAAAGFRTHLGGNIGHSLLDEAERMEPDDVVVLELSSYQLEVLPPPGSDELGAPRVEAAAVTNVLADHLERHGSLEAYAAAKRRILELVQAARGSVVLPAEDARIAAWHTAELRRIDLFTARASPHGLRVESGRFLFDGDVLGRVGDLHLAGAFQRENVLMALGIARLFGAEPQHLATGIAQIRGLPHRLEDLGLFAGHRVWDNGVSTTPDSTISALGSLAPGLTLVCGGQPKALPLNELLAAARGRVRRVVVFGAAVELFGAAFEGAGFETRSAPTVEAAVETALATLGPGEELLFSPACASYDAHLNFRERAAAFRRALAASSPEPARRA